MSNVSHGMNVAGVEALGRLLQTKADQLQQVTIDLTTMVDGTLWEGPDAATFKHQWWPDHRSRLQAVAEQIRGFGQSALNNATEQRGASGEGGVGGIATPLQGGSPNLRGSSPNLRGGLPPAEAASPGSGYGRWFTDGNAWTDDWRDQGNGYDQWNFGYDGDGDAKFGDCTSFVAWRLNQLGHASGHEDFSFTNNHLHGGNGANVDFHLGNARDWYANAGDQFKSIEPQVGSVLVWERGDGKGDFGHVAMVKEVRPDGSMVIEQSAYDSYSYKQQTLPPGSFPKKFLNFLP